MRLKDGIVLGSVDGNDFAIATGKLAKKFNGIINNNKTANYLFTLLKESQTEDSLVEALYEKFDAPKEEIRKDVKEFISKLNEMGILKK